MLPTEAPLGKLRTGERSEMDKLSASSSCNPGRKEEGELERLGGRFAGEDGREFAWGGRGGDFPLRLGDLEGRWRVGEAPTELSRSRYPAREETRAEVELLRGTSTERFGERPRRVPGEGDMEW